jgi:uncharacterized small protein (DUF1192 family)
MSNLSEWIRTCDELEARCNELKAEVERLDTLCKQLSKQHSDISCENIMLRKAGDAMAADLPPFGSVKDWNAAKEGKPSV